MVFNRRRLLLSIFLDGSFDIIICNKFQEFI